MRILPLMITAFVFATGILFSACGSDDDNAPENVAGGCNSIDGGPAVCPDGGPVP